MALDSCIFYSFYCNPYDNLSITTNPAGKSDKLVVIQIFIESTFISGSKGNTSPSYTSTLTPTPTFFPTPLPTEELFRQFM